MSHAIDNVEELNSFTKFPVSVFGPEGRLNGLCRDDVIVDAFNTLDNHAKEEIFGNVSAVNIMCPLKDLADVLIIFITHRYTIYVYVQIEGSDIIIKKVEYLD